MISPIGLSQRSPTPDEEYQSEAERELPGVALTKDSDAANGRHQESERAPWVAAGELEIPVCRDGKLSLGLALVMPSCQELGARDQPNWPESAITNS